MGSTSAVIFARKAGTWIAKSCRKRRVMFCSRLSLLYICEIILFFFTDNKRGKRRVWLKDMKHNDSSCDHLKLLLDQNSERVSKCRFRIRIEKSVQVRSIVLHCLRWLKTVSSTSQDLYFDESL